MLAGMYALMATLSMTFPLLSLIMERSDVAEGVIGLLGAMPSVGLIVAAGFVGAINRRLGTYRQLLFSGLLGAAMFGVLGLFQYVPVWFVALFLMGCAIDGIFVICEGWVNVLAGNHNRGRVIGVYGTVASLGMMTGPIILTLIGTRGAAPFVVGVICLLLFVVPITDPAPARARIRGRAHRRRARFPEAGARAGAGRTRVRPVRVDLLGPVPGLRLAQRVGRGGSDHRHGHPLRRLPLLAAADRHARRACQHAPAARGLCHRRDRRLAVAGTRGGGRRPRLLAHPVRLGRPGRRRLHPRPGRARPALPRRHPARRQRRLRHRLGCGRCHRPGDYRLTDGQLRPGRPAGRVRDPVRRARPPRRLARTAGRESARHATAQTERSLPDTP
ncbi:MAG: MFS transporter [Gammaproteobacteria bacterium]|nr:MFS transporter [Gammaproteobacteria bacterium]